MISLLLAFLPQVQVVVENPVPLARTTWTCFSLPEAKIPRGSLMLGPFQAFVGREIGARTRLIHSQVWMESLERKTLTLTGSADTVLAATATTPEAAPGIRVIANGVVWEPTIVSVQADGPRTEILLRGRIPTTQLIAEMWVYPYANQDSVPWELLVVASDSSTTETYQWVEELRLEVDGVHVVAPWWPRWRGCVQLAPNVVRLAYQTTWADSQGMAWAGVVALTPSSNAGAHCQGPVMAAASKADWEGSWGPFGVVPPVTEDWNGYVGRLQRWLDKTKSTGDLWRGPLIGLAANSGQTGSQDDFGASKLGWTWAGGPSHALEALHSALHEASRPGLWYEPDGSLVEPWRHPNHVTWTGYTHWHSSYSGDRLGKGSSPTPRWSGGYGGPDREHWSNNVLCGAYLLTGSRLLQRVIEKQARQILSGETLDPRLPGTSGIGAPRGIGRTLLSASWIDCCLEPASELRARMQERILARIEQKVEPWTRPPQGAVVAPLGTKSDPRRMGGVECWGWEEPLGLVGLRAAELRFGSVPARVTLVRAASSWVQYGWWHDGAMWRMADNVAYLAGQAPPQNAYPTVTNPVPVEPPLVERTEGFEEWSIGALKIAANVLTGENQVKAQLILRSFPVSKVSEAEWQAVR